MLAWREAKGARPSAIGRLKAPWEQVVTVRPVVDFLIIGSMKSGTTSLHAYLEQHPQISMSSKKEVHFFSGETWDRGIDWYERQFDPVADVRGEASTSYTKFPLVRGVPERIHEVVPNVKLVYLVRDPIERIVSHLHHNILVGLEQPERVDAAVRAADSHYVDVSRYATQLQQYLEWFDPGDVFVTTSEALRGRPDETLRSLCAFLEIDSDHAFTGTDALENVSTRRAKAADGLLSKMATQLRRIGVLPDRLASALVESVPRPALSDDTRAWLVDRLRPEVSELEAFVGRQLPEWKNFA